jgi:hypothetical protein
MGQRDGGSGGASARVGVRKRDRETTGAAPDAPTEPPPNARRLPLAKKSLGFSYTQRAAGTESDQQMKG